MTAVLAQAIPAGAVDRTPPNYGLTVVYTTTVGAAYRCLACNAGTGVGAYDLAGTRTSARMHRETSCPHRDAHHITDTVVAAGQTEYYRTKSNGCGRFVTTDCSVARCGCGWKSWAGSREEVRAAARVHRDTAHRAWLAELIEQATPQDGAR